MLPLWDFVSLCFSGEAFLNDLFFFATKTLKHICVKKLIPQIRFPLWDFVSLCLRGEAFPSALNYEPSYSMSNVDHVEVYQKAKSSIRQL